MVVIFLLALLNRIWPGFDVAEVSKSFPLIAHTQISPTTTLLSESWYHLNTFEKL